MTANSSHFGWRWSMAWLVEDCHFPCCWTCEQLKYDQYEEWECWEDHWGEWAYYIHEIEHCRLMQWCCSCHSKDWTADQVGNQSSQIKVWIWHDVWQSAMYSESDAFISRTLIPRTSSITSISSMPLYQWLTPRSWLNNCMDPLTLDAWGFTVFGEMPMRTHHLSSVDMQ